MGIKVRGTARVERNIDRILNDIQGRKVIRALQSAMILGAARAALYTPIDTSALLNSQFREIVTDGAVITGRVSGSANTITSPCATRNQAWAHWLVLNSSSIRLVWSSPRSSRDMALMT